MSVGTSITTDTSTTPVIASAWPDPDVPDLSLPDALLGVAAERPGQAAITDAASGRTLSYGELAGAVRRVAAGLAAHGLRPGDTFAILAPNSPEWLVACFGAMAAGGVVTGLNQMCTPDEVAAQLADSTARFLLTDPAVLPTARAAADQVAARGADNRHLVIVTRNAERGTLGFGDLMAHGATAPRGPADPAALALLPYSSGTTGRAKGVMLSHRAVLTNLVQTLTLKPPGPPRGCSRSRRSSMRSGWSCSPGVRCSAGRRWSRCPGSRYPGSWPRCRITGSPRPWSCRRSRRRWPGTPR